MDYTPHLQHLARHRDSLRDKLDRIKHKAAKHTGKVVQTVEVATGAALGGLIQGLAKDPSTGAKIFHVPVDAGLGVALSIAGHLDLAGKEWSPHLDNLGNGFIAAYATDLGHAVGSRKRTTGSFFPKRGVAELAAVQSMTGLPAAAVHGDVTPQQMAEQLLSQMQGG